MIMTDDINKLIHPDLQMSVLETLKIDVRKQILIGVKTFGIILLKHYVRSMIRWTILERQYTNEYILFA